MKTILLATDFSASAKDAARYGFDLACQIKAKIIIVNAMIIAAEMPQSGFAYWPGEEFDGLLHDYEAELQHFKSELEAGVEPGAYCPPVQCINEAGRFTDVIIKAVAENKADLVVIGTHRGGLLSRLLIGNHAEQLMDATTGPLLIVKPGTVFQPVKKIAYATEFMDPKKDLEIIYRLVAWAKLLKAGILLAHVTHKPELADHVKKTLGEYLTELSNKANYPNIYYRLIYNDKTEAGLTWLCEHGQVDMLAMAHRSRHLPAEIFGHSHTKSMNELSELPLLVFPLIDN
ncbi:MAG TPA: universal stress protein [Mucilaginibacter sp.]|jgi:nucleotide-binding universal stress UspA family protein|nr:universal stress protein [Mucilaginibacter sp.]